MRQFEGWMPKRGTCKFAELSLMIIALSERRNIDGYTCLSRYRQRDDRRAQRSRIVSCFAKHIYKLGGVRYIDGSRSNKSYLRELIDIYQALSGHRETHSTGSGTTAVSC